MTKKRLICLLLALFLLFSAGCSASGPKIPSTETTQSTEETILQTQPSTVPTTVATGNGGEPISGWAMICTYPDSIPLDSETFPLRIYYGHYSPVKTGSDLDGTGAFSSALYVTFSDPGFGIGSEDYVLRYFDSEDTNQDEYYIGGAPYGDYKYPLTIQDLPHYEDYNVPVSFCFPNDSGRLYVVFDALLFRNTEQEDIYGLTADCICYSVSDGVIYLSDGQRWPEREIQ